jgi:hypothetical protein
MNVYLAKRWLQFFRLHHLPLHPAELLVRICITISPGSIKIYTKNAAENTVMEIRDILSKGIT